MQTNPILLLLVLVQELYYTHIFIQREYLHFIRANAGTGSDGFVCSSKQILFFAQWLIRYYNTTYYFSTMCEFACLLCPFCFSPIEERFRVFVVAKLFNNTSNNMRMNSVLLLFALSENWAFIMDSFYFKSLNIMVP